MPSWAACNGEVKTVCNVVRGIWDELHECHDAGLVVSSSTIFCCRSFSAVVLFSCSKPEWNDKPAVWHDTMICGPYVKQLSRKLEISEPIIFYLLIVHSTRVFKAINWCYQFSVKYSIWFRFICIFHSLIWEVPEMFLSEWKRSTVSIKHGYKDILSWFRWEGRTKVVKILIKISAWKGRTLRIHAQSTQRKIAVFPWKAVELGQIAKFFFPSDPLAFLTPHLLRPSLSKNRLLTAQFWTRLITILS